MFSMLLCAPCIAFTSVILPPLLCIDLATTQQQGILLLVAGSNIRFTVSRFVQSRCLLQVSTITWVFNGILFDSNLSLERLEPNWIVLQHFPPWDFADIFSTAAYGLGFGEWKDWSTIA